MRPIASLSLDLDNQWSYLKTHGNPGWESFPSFLDAVMPRVLEFLRARNLKITFFLVGQDAALEKNREPLQAVAAAGHEIGNHSFHHEPWLHLYTEPQIEEEIALAEEHIEQATGKRPVGFRGPGYSLSEATLRVLARRGYRYDASTFPTFLGPLARAYYFLTARLSDEEKRRRRMLFGSFREGFRPLKPYRWHFSGDELIEMPVTTMPLFKVPIHLSYQLYLGGYSRRAACSYFQAALALCRLTGTQPSLLLHPLDFLGREDAQELAFFPAMRLPRALKLEIVSDALERFSKEFEVLTIAQHAEAALSSPLPLVKPWFCHPAGATGGTR